MLVQEVTNISFDSFREMSKGKKVILLYPWMNYRNVFLSYFLDNAKEGLLYHRAVGQQDNLAQWLSKMVAEFDTVLGGFGKKLEAALPDASPTELGRALARDLDDFRKDPLILFLDELDRVPQDDDFRAFIRSLVDALPARAQLAVNSRLLSYQPWVEMVAAKEAVVLGPTNRRSNLLFTLEEFPKPQVEVYGFGRGHVLTNGEPIESWDGALPRNLFFYFIDNPLVTRDQIFGVFWPNLGVKEATNVFHVTKRKITERISACVGDGENYELTRYSAGFYMPSDKVVRHYDVTDFEEAIDRALMAENESEREKMYRQAVELYRAPFLQTIDMPWVHERREQLRGMYADALIGLGRMYQGRGNLETALGFFTRSLKEVPYREDIHREVMKIYADMGRREEVMYQYNALEKYLKETVGIEPSSDTKQILDLISRD